MRESIQDVEVIVNQIMPPEDEPLADIEADSAIGDENRETDPDHLSGAV